MFLRKDAILKQVFLSCLLMLGAFQRVSAQSAAAPQLAADRWEAEIQAFENSDKTKAPETGGVLFIGSSTIRLWKTLAQDFPQLKVINRGFGGSQIEDSLRYADRIIIPYKPHRIILYAGGNDLNSGKTPERVAEDFKQLIARLRQQLPDTRITYISILASPARWHLDEKIRQTNDLIKTFVAHEGHRLSYLDAYPRLLGTDGKPRPELYVEDRLHLNEAGYRVLQAAVAAHLKTEKK
ncbi:MAG: hypothetical protein H0T92_20040 [Pyrinomonadaceae bacterium]|nr:hypothetical protein [Pyrinomonadaceae bacterium]